MYLASTLSLVLTSVGQGNSSPQGTQQTSSNTYTQEDKMAWLGMNLETVKGELPKWQNLAEELNGVINNVNTQVQQANEAWNGPDSEKFVSEWEGQHRPALEKIKGLIEQLCEQLQSDIQQQAEISGS